MSNVVREKMQSCVAHSAWKAVVRLCPHGPRPRGTEPTPSLGFRIEVSRPKSGHGGRFGPTVLVQVVDGIEREVITQIVARLDARRCERLQPRRIRNAILPTRCRN